MDPSLHERIARALGWTVAECQGFSLVAFRDLLRPEHPDLVYEIGRVIQTGSHIRQPTRG